MTDIEIANSIKKKDIVDVAKEIGIIKDNLILYGNDKAKIINHDNNRKGHLILVTAISPTPMGEGKTTVSIGLNDALRKLNKNSIAVLREPSMGPVFGMKGGATGGGYSQVVPMEDINLQFTGDFDAISAANNLICAAIDNHIYFDNKLDIQRVTFNRCLDVNDRFLRSIKGEREESFNITAASEIMALFCLAKDEDDLKNRLSNIVVGYNSKNEMIYVKDLNLQGSLAVLLKNAIKPNLVQSLENNPVIIHGGPFANIAHGCNSVIGTNTGLSLCDYVVTEAGFGADLGAEKFLDIKCRLNDLKPDCVVLVATIKALKYHGGVPKEDVMVANSSALKDGLCNLEQHIDNLSQYGVNLVVCLNKFDGDLDEEIEIVKDFCDKKNVSFSTSTAYINGGDGAINLANKVIDSCDKAYDFKLLYEDDLSIKEKINTICSKIYHTSKVNYSDESNKIIEYLENNNKCDLPICIAKTQYSFSDDPKKLGAPKDFEVTVKDVRLYNGAGFITVLLGNIMTMPGLPRVPNYEHIDLVNGKIIGLS